MRCTGVPTETQIQWLPYYNTTHVERHRTVNTFGHVQRNDVTEVSTRHVRVRGKEHVGEQKA